MVRAGMHRRPNAAWVLPQAVHAVSLAEICVGAEDPDLVVAEIRAWGIEILDIPASAAVLSARAYRAYRERRRRQSSLSAPAMPLPDFFIGAHARGDGRFAGDGRRVPVQDLLSEGTADPAVSERHPSARSVSQIEPHGPSNYAAIRRQRQEDYGKKVHKLGSLSEKQYADPRHFLLELLQNAEDALARRPAEPPVAERGVTFDLTEDSLRVGHFGDPFNRADVESICDFDESTKGLEGIGRFGLGFKSVYRFTERPEVHSGSEDFVIRNYVWPESAEPVDPRGIMRPSSCSLANPRARIGGLLPTAFRRCCPAPICSSSDTSSPFAGRCPADRGPSISESRTRSSPAFVA